MKLHWKDLIAAWGGMLALLAAALALKAVVDPWLNLDSAFLFTGLAVTITAWRFGYAPSLACLLLGSIAHTFSPEPVGSITLGDPAQAILLIIYTFGGWLLVALFEDVRRGRVITEATRNDLARQRAETAAMREKLEVALNSLDDPLWLLRAVRDKSGRIVDFTIDYINEAGAQTNIDSPLSREQQIGQPLSAIAPRLKELGIVDAYIHVLETGEPLKKEIDLPKAAEDAQPATYEVRATRLGDGLVAQWRDRSSDRMAQESLRLSEKRYRSLVKASAAIVWHTPETGTIETEQPEWSAFTGQSFEELRGWGWITSIHPEDRTRIAQAWSDSVMRRTPYQVELRMRRHDGEYRHMSVQAVPLLNERGRVREWVGVCNDVSEQKQAEQIVSDSERHLRRVLNSLFTFVGVLTPDGTLQSTNEAPLRAADLKLEDVRGKKLWDTYWWSHSAEVQQRLREAVARAVGGEPSRYDVDMRVAGGALMTIDFMLAPMRDETGAITHLIPSGVDISARKRAERSLRDSEEQLRAFFESTTTGMVQLDASGKFLRINKAFCRFVGYDREELLNMDMSKVTHPEDWARDEKAMKDMLAGVRTGYCVEKRYVRKDGTIRWGQVDMTMLRDHEGRPSRIVCVITDTTERKLAEQALRLSDERLDLSLRYAKAGAWDWNARTGHMNWTKAYRDLIGYDSLIEPTYETWLESIHPADREMVNQRFQELLASGKEDWQCEYRIIHPDFGERWLASIGKLETEGGKPVRLSGIALDISERKSAETALAESERRFREAFTHAPFGMTITDLEGRFLHVNRAYCEIVGYEESELLGTDIDFQRLTHPDDLDERLRTQQALIEGRVPTYTLEQRYIRKDGRPVWVRVSASLRRDRAGRPTQVLGLIEDITARRNAELELAERERHYRELTEGLPQLVWTATPDAAWDFVNSRWAEYTGAPPESQLGSGWLDVLHPEDRDAAHEAWKQAVATGTPMSIEVRIRRFDGIYHWFDMRAMPLRNSEAKVVRWFGTNQDIEDRRRAQEEILRLNQSLERRIAERTAEAEARSEQLRALALDLAETESRERKRLAQLLHDHFQQLLSAAKLKVGIVRRRAADAPAVDSLRQIESLLEEAINASRSLATELSPPVLHDAGLGAALEWLARRMQRDHNLMVHLDLDSRCEPDNEQVRIIFFECARELLFNVVKHAGVQQAHVSLTMPHEGLIQLRVQDRGKGFDANRAAVNRKPDGSFGLFSIKERLSLIGGLVRIRSTPGEGTTAELTVPVTTRARVEETARRTIERVNGIAAASGDTRRVRVLVADDHKLFREGLISLLSQESYVTVIGQAGDGAEAVDMARQLKPDVMIVDVTMPKLNGVQVTSVITKELPETKVIGLSMHERDDMAEAMREAGAVAYCTKGGPTETLLGILRSTAAARSNGHGSGVSHQPGGA